MSRYLEAAACAADVTLSVTQNLEARLSERALALFLALHQVAVEAAAERAYSPAVSEVELFCPVEAVALALGVHRATVYRAAAELRALGMVHHRAHYTTHRGRTRADGAVWAVRLRPVGGRAARLSYGFLKRAHRNLSGDVERGRTVWAAMRQSKKIPSKGVDLSFIRRWALSPTEQTPVTPDCRTSARRSLEALLDVQHAARKERSAAVELAAEALAAALRDRGGVMFYRRLLWQLLRRADATGAAPFGMVYEQARRAAADVAEGYGRRPGAVFVSRLKRAGWWREVMAAPPVRVGVRPVEA